jgi:L-2-hydroxyglutarate oxidase LhgO
LGEKYFSVDRSKKIVETNVGKINAGYVINTSGLYADKIAKDFGFSKNHRVVPFKGLYLYPNKEAYKPRVNIYPVPNLSHPFLGVHFTTTAYGDTKIGPTAIPAFWREHYNGLDNFSLSELVEIVFRESRLFLSNHFGFRDIAYEELKKYSKKYMVAEACSMLGGAEKMGFDTWGKPGIRAQLVDIRENKLEMDFLTEGDEFSYHVLNAVSPAFTCSMPFVDFITDDILENCMIKERNNGSYILKDSSS